VRILFTGTSSFTGAWFARELAARGHHVVATLRGSADSYEGIRARRVVLAAERCDPRYAVAFGDERFLALLEDEGPFDVICHHAAEVGDYRSPDFDVHAAVAANTRSLPRVLRALKEQGARGLVLTGSVFEQGEGVGEPPLRAFSPYGLSKGLTSALVAFYAGREEVGLGKFVIPNPFGPLEEPRFTAYLVRTWREGKVPTVSTPSYVRDNIHVSLLARAYARFVEALAPAASTRLAPSGYAESQGAFARRFADELAPRLGIPCPLELAVQTEFPEPRIRVNSDPADRLVPDWDEAAAWDGLARYYLEAG
jgi:nucleoside-diphosphate-sugar epimerase